MFFSKSKGPKITDVIFLNYNGYLTAIRKWMEQNTNGIVAVWFQHDLERLRQAVSAETENRFVLADRLAFNHSDENKALLFAGHYPLHASEEQLCAELGIDQMLVYSHLDMALFNSFGSGNIKDLMVKMGTQEDEPISHAMITKAISSAQEKIAKSCTADLRALSEDEWMGMNVQR